MNQSHTSFIFQSLELLVLGNDQNKYVSNVYIIMLPTYKELKVKGGFNKNKKSQINSIAYIQPFFQINH